MSRSIRPLVGKRLGAGWKVCVWYNVSSHDGPHGRKWREEFADESVARKFREKLVARHPERTVYPPAPTHVLSRDGGKTGFVLSHVHESRPRKSALLTKYS